MALKLVEGFDHFSKFEINDKFWTGTPAGMAAGRSILPNSQSVTTIQFNDLTKSLPSDITSGLAVCGFAIKPHAFNITVFSFGGAAVIYIDGAGLLHLTDGSARELGAAATPLPFNGWTYVEVKVDLDAQTAEVHLNGNPSADIGPVSGSFSDVGSVTIKSQDRGGFGGTADFDDIYVLDSSGSVNNDLLGDIVVQTLLPDADGTHTDWTPNAGSDHFSRVDEQIMDGDSTYVTSSTPGDIDTYDMQPVGAGAAVLGAQLNLAARKDEGTFRQVEPVIRQSGTDHTGPTSTLGLSYVFYSWLLDQDPTGSDWTGTTVDSDEYGMELVA